MVPIEVITIEHQTLLDNLARAAVMRHVSISGSQHYCGYFGYFGIIVVHSGVRLACPLSSAVRWLLLFFLKRNNVPFRRPSQRVT